ncbi:hypothetical protein Tco_0675636 [Tanacetum coccineum]
MDVQNEINRLQGMLNLRNSNQDPPVDLYDLKGRKVGTVEHQFCDDLECNMPVNTPLPTTDVREEDFDINSPLGEQVVDFLMENEDVAGLPRYLILLSEVERLILSSFDTEMGGTTRVMETLSFGFYHMPSPRPDAYSPKEVMYPYYHLHLTSGDGFDHKLLSSKLRV